MYALEGDGFHHAAELSLLGCGDNDVLGTNHHVHRRVGAEALVHTFELSAENAHAAVAHHDAVEDVCLADKVRDKGVDGLVVDLLRRADLFDHTVVHHNHAVAHGQRFLLVMGDVDKGLFGLLLNLLELELHAFAQLEVECAERLVEKNDRRIADQGSRNGDALLLTAGELGDRALFVALQVNNGEHFEHLFFYFFLWQLFELETKGNIVKYVEMRKQ